MKIIREAAAAELLALLVLLRNAPINPMPGTELRPGQHGPLRQVADRHLSKAQVLRRIARCKIANNIAGMVQLTQQSPQWHSFVSNPTTAKTAKQILQFVTAGRVYV